jgi:hypothetical protein
LGKVIEDLNKIKSITVGFDALNKKDMKLFPIVVRTFCQTVVFTTKLYTGETSDLQCGALKEVTNMPYKTKLLLGVQITRTPVLVVAKNLIKIMRGENLELN